MTIRLERVTSRGKLRYVPLLAAGVSVFLGLAILGDLLGVLRHIEAPWMFGGWVKLGPSVPEWMAEWTVWGACMLILISPSLVALARRKAGREPIMALTFLVFPSLSLVIMFVSPHVGATLLVGSGLLAAYLLTSRSRTQIDIPPSSARRVICAVVFGLLALSAAGDVICVLLWQAGAFFNLTSSISQIATDELLGSLAADLKVFYIAQPILPAVFLVIALAAIFALFSEPARRLVKSLTRRKPTGVEAQAFQREGETHPSLAYIALLGSLGLGIAATVYPILQFHWVSPDYVYYVGQLYSMRSSLDVVPLVQTGRSLFLLLLFSISNATGASIEDAVRFAPAMLSVLLALSSFFLVREGTGRLWVSSLAAILSTVSVQTTLGMYGGIIANWFALSIVNFTFAMIVRSIRLRSPVAAVGSILLSLALLAGYAYMWVVAVVELLLALVGSIAAFRADDWREWRFDVGILSGILLGITLIAFGLFSIVAALDPSSWLAMGWRYAQAAGVETIGSAVTTLRLNLSLASGRMELPFLALLSVLGLLDHRPRTSCFTKIVAAIVLVPLAIELVPAAPYYFALRGLYLIPLYMLGALGAESVIRRVNGHAVAWKTTSGLAFAGTFTAYLILSQVGYTLRMFGLPLLPLH